MRKDSYTPLKDWTSMIRLTKKKLTITPAKSILAVEVPKWIWDNDQTIIMARKAPKKEKTVIPDIPKTAKENPILEYCRYLVFEKVKSLNIKRSEKFGGDLNIGSYKELEGLYSNGNLHPADLKTSVAAEINNLIEPIRKHFSTNARARSLAEQVKSFEVTR